MKLTGAIAMLVVAASPDAIADDKRNATLVWAAAGIEAGTAGVFALAFTTSLHDSSAAATALTFTPFVLGAGAGYLAYRAELSPTPPLVAHGAAWAGLDLFLAGTLIDGRHSRHRMKIGPAAIGMGAAGAIGGGILAALSKTGTSDSALLAAPSLGFVGGGIVIGGILVLAGGIDGDKAPSQFATGAIVGTTIGLGIATYFVATRRGSSATSATALTPMPRLELDRTRTIVSFGGAF